MNVPGYLLLQIITRTLAATLTRELSVTFNSLWLRIFRQIYKHIVDKLIPPSSKRTSLKQEVWTRNVFLVFFYNLPSNTKRLFLWFQPRLCQAKCSKFNSSILIQFNIYLFNTVRICSIQSLHSFNLIRIYSI